MAGRGHRLKSIEGENMKKGKRKRGERNERRKTRRGRK
jgi:hypothetical protein